MERKYKKNLIKQKQEFVQYALQMLFDLLFCMRNITKKKSIESHSKYYWVNQICANLDASMILKSVKLKGWIRIIKIADNCTISKKKNHFYRMDFGLLCAVCACLCECCRHLLWKMFMNVCVLLGRK